PNRRCWETRSSPPPRRRNPAWGSRPRCRRSTHRSASAARRADRPSPSPPARAGPTTARRRGGTGAGPDAMRGGPWAHTRSDRDEISDLIRSNDYGTLLRLKRLAGDDQLDQGGETVFAGAEGRHQGVRGVGVAAGERPAQGIGHDLACHRPPEVVGPRADQL